MGTFNAIRDASEVLKGVLDNALREIGATCIVHDLVTTPAVGMTLTLTLYEIAEDPSARNRPDQRVVVNDRVETRRSPVSLLLRYLITAWSGNILDDQRILGRAIQALYDEAIVGGPALTGTSLADNDETLAVSMIQQSIEDRTHVWRAYDKAYRLSVNYEVRVVKLEARRARTAPQVRSRSSRHGLLEDTP